MGLLAGLSLAPSAAAQVKLDTLRIRSVDTTKSFGIGDEVRVTVCNLPLVTKLADFDARKLVLHVGGHRLKGVTGRVVVPGMQVLAFTLTSSDSSREAWAALARAARRGQETFSVGIAHANGTEIQWAQPLRAPEGTDNPLTPPRTNADSAKADSIRGAASVQANSATCAPLTDEQQALKLDLRSTLRSVIAWILLALTLLVFVLLLCTRQGVTEAPSPLAASPGTPAVSLSKTQMAFWFFVGLGTFFYIWVVTGEFNNIITPQVLILMAISGGTALGTSAVRTLQQAAAVQTLRDMQSPVSRIAALTATAPTGLSRPLADEVQSLRDSLSLSERVEASKLGKPTRKSLLGDLFRDDTGVSLPRLQLGIWTMVLGVMFVVFVVHELAFPSFDNNLLLLMGISNGAYLGFRTSERQPLT